VGGEGLGGGSPVVQFHEPFEHAFPIPAALHEQRRLALPKERAAHAERLSSAVFGSEPCDDLGLQPSNLDRRVARWIGATIGVGSSRFGKHAESVRRPFDRRPAQPTTGSPMRPSAASCISCSGRATRSYPSLATTTHRTSSPGASVAVETTAVIESICGAW